ncbi:MAG: hypothetical protein FJ076_00395 [Cyanobacteria bacterium K_DeepCast_35m_m1_288]|nr:hypothetical protein [Cyanobacteria bacterium K_DeepCast_35m_m1_288]
MSVQAIATPSAEQLLALERQAREQGTGLDAEALQGRWQLELVWPKGTRRPSAFSGWLLRGLSARLEISTDAEGLALSNDVNLGPLELRFRGVGKLLGRRPLLQFRFQQLQVSLGGRLLIQRELPTPAAKRMPFFALIARDPGGWLAARGRGGGLAVWTLASAG